jgi:hypothetical protein
MYPWHLAAGLHIMDTASHDTTTGRLTAYLQGSKCRRKLVMWSPPDLNQAPRVEVPLHAFLTSVSDVPEWSFHAPAALLPVSIGQEAGWAPQPIRTWWQREELPYLWALHADTVENSILKYLKVMHVFMCNKYSSGVSSKSNPGELNLL